MEHAAVSVVAPLTGKLLVESAALAKGDVIVQNNAFSTVGQAVVQYAAAAGIHTVNIARKRDDWANHVYHLQGLGAGEWWSSPCMMMMVVVVVWLPA